MIKELKRNGLIAIAYILFHSALASCVVFTTVILPGCNKNEKLAFTSSLDFVEGERVMVEVVRNSEGQVKIVSFATAGVGLTVSSTSRTSTVTAPDGERISLPKDGKVLLCRIGKTIEASRVVSADEVPAEISAFTIHRMFVDVDGKGIQEVK